MPKKEITTVTELVEEVRNAYESTHLAEESIPLDKKIVCTFTKPVGTRSFKIDLGELMSPSMIVAILFQALHQTMEIEFKKHQKHHCPEKELLARLLYSLGDLLSDEAFEHFSKALFEKVKKGEIAPCPLSDLEFKKGYCANCNNSHEFPNL